MLRALTLATGLLAAAPLSAAELRLSVPAGAAAETVFDWSSEACDPWDVPDVAARAWRAEDGSVRLVASHFRARVMSGPSLDDLRQNCEVAFAAGGEDDPARHDDKGWIASTWTPDGRTVYALVHNEFEGHKRRELCPVGGYMQCWWNTLLLTVSRDGGRSFEAPGRFVAGLPYRFRGDLGRRAGIFQPGNIVLHDGWHYAMAYAEAVGEQRRGTCLMRTRDLSDPASWRAWDGRGFTVRFVDPYAEDAEPAAHVCAPLPTDRLPFTVFSLVRHAPSGLYAAIMAGRKDGVTGFWASSSPDLLNWSRPHLVMDVPLLTHPDCAKGVSFYYPAALDPDSPSRNFEDMDDAAFLYLTRLALQGCKPGKDRDLVRFPLTVGLAP